jgi:hypothetical protein
MKYFLYTRVLFVSVLFLTCFIGFDISKVYADDLSSGLVGHWTLDENNPTSGVTVIDSSVKIHDGVWHSSGVGTYSGVGVIGTNAGLFQKVDGGDFQYIEIPDNADYSFTTGFSASVWVKPSSFTEVWNAILTKDSWDQGGWMLLVYSSIDSNGTVCYGGASYVKMCSVVAEGVLPLDIWSNIIITNNNGSANMYINGALVANGTIPIDSSYNTLFPMNIGARDNNGTDVFNGLIDDVRVYDRVLTAGEIATLSERTQTPTFNPEAGYVAPGSLLTITSTGADHIFYTTDGNTPSSEDSEYIEPFALNGPFPMTIKAIATTARLLNSNVSSTTYNESVPISGGGTISDPYQINTCKQLQAIGREEVYFSADAYFKLMDNVDCSVSNYNLVEKFDGTTWDNYGFDPIGDSSKPFIGHFDGDGKTVSGLYIERSGEDYVGLFAYSRGEIKDLILDGVDVSGRNRVGGLVGRIGIGGTVDNVDVFGDIFGFSYVGGLAGGSLGSITNSNTNVSVVGDENSSGGIVRSYVGGLVGGSAGIINNCTSSGTVTALGWDNDLNFSNGGLVGVLSATGTITNSSSSSNVDGIFAVGGLAGSALGDISDSFATGDIVADDSYSGGLVGSLSGDVTDSYATGDVDGNYAVGGLVGVADNGPSNKGNISDSYATGNVTNDNSREWTGGLVGATNASITRSWASGDVTASNGYKVGGLVGGLTGSIFSSYATGNVVGNDNVGGLIGYNEGGHIEDTYATGDVTGYTSGGLVGKSFDKTIVNSYATGDVTGTIAGGLIGHLEGDFVYNSYSGSKIISTTDENLVETYGQDHIIGGLIGLMLYREGESIGTYVFNCGWYKSADNSLLSGIGLSGISGGDYASADVYYTETNNNVFYSKDYGIYKNSVEYTWDFSGEPWYEHISDYPKFIAEILPDPTCSDGIQNQDETGLDSGGVCTTVYHKSSGGYLPGNGPRINVAPVVAPITPTVTETKFIFTKNLKYLMIDDEVKELQKFLNFHGFYVSLTGPGSKGFETNKFGLLTQKALIKFQLANNIKPAVGYFGPITRGIVNGM